MKKVSFLFLVLTFFAGNLSAQIISTIAGNPLVLGGYSGDGGPATASVMNNPYSVTADGKGNIFFADYFNNCIRKINASGVITTVAGNSVSGFSGDGGPATLGQLSRPTGVAVDTGGNIYITDFQNHRVRKVNTSGMLSTIAGKGTGAFSGDGGPATAAEVSSPWGITVDAPGNIYISDCSNNRIRKIDPLGIISTIAGNGTLGFAGDGAQATAGELNQPTDVALDVNGNVFIADRFNNRIRKVSSTTGNISTVAGSAISGYSGDGIPATAAELTQPLGVYVDASGNIFIADAYNHRVRKVNTSGIISTIAGIGSSGFSGDGGPATSAQLYFPDGIIFDIPG